jgi:hypothetical protein
MPINHITLRWRLVGRLDLPPAVDTTAGARHDLHQVYIVTPALQLEGEEVGRSSGSVDNMMACFLGVEVLDDRKHVGLHCSIRWR